MSAAGKERMARFASLKRERARLMAQLADLDAQEATLLDEFAENDVDLRTGRRAPRAHVPTLGPVSELDQARADRALQKSDSKRRLRP
jgi:hypothetical protein